MPNAHHGRLVTLIVLLVVGMLPTPNAIAQDHSCNIRSQANQLFIIVYDVFPDGNSGNLIWQGILKNGQQIAISAQYGRFFFRYRTDPDAQSDVINGVIRFCRNNETIRLP